MHVTMKLVHIKTPYLDELIHNPLTAKNSKMTVGWMFQGQGDLLLDSILILVLTHISVHLLYLAICPHLIQGHLWTKVHLLIKIV